MEPVPPLPPMLYERIVERALREDFGGAGDVTSDAVIPAGTTGTALVVARAAGTIAGLEVAASAFTRLDPGIVIRPLAADGDEVTGGMQLASIEGSLRSILGAERVSLNILGRMCGVATTTRKIAAAVRPHGARVACTRKTTPGLRVLEKYAVRVGGGANHRFGLDDAVLIKDNHVAVAGGIIPAIERARARTGHLVKIEVEVDTLAQLEEALSVGADAVLLDNMSPDTLRQAVAMVDGRAVTEASGRINRETVGAVAASGVDLISVGWITHSSAIIDLGLDAA